MSAALGIPFRIRENRRGDLSQPTDILAAHNRFRDSFIR